MARTGKKKAAEKEVIIHAPARPQPITETIEKNYMPYVMTVILARALPEIDGLKPAHRKLLYTMYKMGLLTGSRTKSANVVGQTMKLNPHGDAAIYDTMVRLTRDNETLLHPLVDSKGTFGKVYSEMPPAASRYTEVKLEAIAAEMFRGIDKDAVDMVDNYDGSMKEPSLLPTTFPNILVMPTSGIAVGMASDICSFNLCEICDGTIALLKKPSLSTEKLMEIIKGPDFSGGGFLLYDAEGMREVFETGQGSVRLRARYQYDKANNCIDITQIPYSTTTETIMRKLREMVKANKLKEVTDFRDETDKSGLRLTLDLRRGVDPDKLMLKLFHQSTTLENNVKCNFNILVDGAPRQMGVKEILTEWIRFRMGCVSREIRFDLGKKQDKLHLLMGLGAIIMDIDEAIRIIRNTKDDDMIIPNLMAGFNIDEIQANYIAEIKLRNLNQKYLLDRIAEITELKNDIAELESILADEIKLKSVIAKQLTEIKKEYGQPRKTIILEPPFPTYDPSKSEAEEAVPTRILFTKEGYLKRLAMPRAGAVEEQRLKEGDSIVETIEVEQTDELLFFTDRAQLFRARVSEFDVVKPSQMGDFLAPKLGMSEGERPLLMLLLRGSLSPKDHIVLVFENGKGVRIPLSAYETKAYRRKLTGAYSEASPIVAVLHEKNNKPLDMLLKCSDKRGILIKSSLIPEKATRTSVGVQLIQLKPKAKLTDVFAAPAADNKFEGASCRKIKIPATSVELKKGDIPAEFK